MRGEQPATGTTAEPRAWLWALVLSAGLAVSTATLLLPGLPAHDAVRPLITGAAAIAMLAGLRRGRIHNRLPWQLFAASLAATTLAGGLHYFLRHVTGEPVFPSPADAVSLVGHVLAAAGGLTLSRRAGRDATVDALLVTVPLAMLLWLTATGHGGVHTGWFVQAAAIAGPVGALVVVFGAIRAMFTVEMRKLPSILLTAGLTGWFLSDALRITDRLHGGEIHGPLIDIGYSAMPVFLAAAALHPRVHEINAARRPRQKAVMSVPRFVTVAAGVISIGVLAAWQGDTRVRILCTALVLAAVVATVRVARVIKTTGRRAIIDPLTGLPNRPELLRRLGVALAEIPADGSRNVALLFCDLDHFKDVNDSLGHEAGDQMLIAVAERLTGCVRDTDVVARLGGDEFVILMPATGPDEAMTVAGRLSGVFTTALTVAGTEVHPSVSVGLRITSDPHADPAALLRDSDAAMYHAKAGGRGRTELYDDRFTTEAADRLRLDADLRRALATGGELTCVFHPEIDLATGRLYALEALVRWNHPERGLLFPDAFVGYAEEHAHLINGIFQAVLDAALSAQDRWLAEFGWRPTVAVNVSPAQASDPAIVDWITTALIAHQAPASALIIEVTETGLADSAAMATTLTALRERGVAVAVDDFGTGYSSVERLAKPHWDALKIDRSFTAGIAADQSRAGVVRAMVAMAHALGLSAVAEGVEDAETLDELRTIGCDTAQGYYYTRPVGADVISTMIADNPAWRRPAAETRMTPVTS
jgi:diguanylate cyclase (GGDEF)-like protein